MRRTRKKAGTALSDEELNVIFDKITQDSSVSNFDSYYAKKKAKPVSEKKPVKKSAPKDKKDDAKAKKHQSQAAILQMAEQVAKRAEEKAKKKQSRYRRQEQRARLVILTRELIMSISRSITRSTRIFRLQTP